MHFELDYINIIIIAFFLISLYVLVINLYTIRSLQKERKESSDNQRLLTQLLEQIQGYFGKIDINITSLSEQEKGLREIIKNNQNEENLVLEAIESNQATFIDRMDRIIGIQKSLSQLIMGKQMENSSEDSDKYNESSKLLQLLNQFTTLHKHEFAHLNGELRNLPSIVKRLDSLEENIEHLRAQIMNNDKLLEFDTAIKEHSVSINNSFRRLKEQLEEEIAVLHMTLKLLQDANTNVVTLNNNVSIAKRNITQTVEQSIDLSPIYKSIHELIEKTRTMYAQYFHAQNDIGELINVLKGHEKEDLQLLRDDVEGFLAQLNMQLKDSVSLLQKEINDSVKLLKKEFHLGQNQLSDSVNRSKISQVYKDNIEE